MGIQGLLPFLKKAAKPVNIRSFSGCTVAIDAYCWLHKGAFSCAEKLVKGEKTDGYVHYCINMVNMLLSAGVKPILVFDGRALPSKNVTEQARRKNREKYRMKAKEFLLLGQLKEAKECFQRCVDVTPEMAFAVIQACRQKNIDYIVAPYEADSQLAYLNKCGIAHIIITEDSDLLLFGCEKVIFKMDKGGSGIMIEKSSLYQCMGISVDKFTFEKFRYMCILSGCDYLPSLPGIGLAKSCKFFKISSNPNIDFILPKLPTYLKMPNLVVTSEYKDAFVRANNAFLYQLVFCPLQRKLVPLNDYPSDIHPSELQYAGAYFSDKVAYQLALGNVDVNTMKLIDNFDPANNRRITRSITWDGKATSAKSIWDKDYKTMSFCSPNLSFKSTNTKRKVIDIDVLKSINKQPLPSDGELFMMYSKKRSNVDHIASSPCKKPRLESFTEKTEGESECPRPKAVNVFKVRDCTPNTIVRSRFFFTPVKESLKNSKVVPWLDEIQKQYRNSLCSTPKSSYLENTSISPKQQEEEVNLSTESTDIEMTKSNNIWMPNNMGLASKGNKDFGFKWNKSMKYVDKVIPNDCILKMPFKTAITTKSLNEIQKENYNPLDRSENISQISNNSIDSAYLSQESDLLLSSCSSQEDNQNKSYILTSCDLDNAQTISENDEVSCIKNIKPVLQQCFSKKSSNEKISQRCRRTGLSRNKKKIDKLHKTDLQQLNLKESFEKFKFLKQTTSKKSLF